jgi:hypothetical protein
MHRLVNDRNKFKPYMAAGRDSSGMVLTEPSKIMEQWRKYFQNLLRDLNVVSMEITQELQEEMGKNTERTEE